MNSAQQSQEVDEPFNLKNVENIESRQLDWLPGEKRLEYTTFGAMEFKAYFTNLPVKISALALSLAYQRSPGVSAFLGIGIITLA